MPHYFTLAEARQHLPAVSKAVREGIEAKKALAAADSDHRARVEKIMFSGGMAVDQEAASHTRQVRDQSASRLKSMLECFEEIGCVVKDLEIGLIDFPCLYRGKEVYLCWRLGEPDIEFWHPVEAGFAGRRKIDQDFLRECGGDQS